MQTTTERPVEKKRPARERKPSEFKRGPLAEKRGKTALRRFKDAIYTMGGSIEKEMPFNSWFGGEGSLVYFSAPGRGERHELYTAFIPDKADDELINIIVGRIRAYQEKRHFEVAKADPEFLTWFVRNGIKGTVGIVSEKEDGEISLLVPPSKLADARLAKYEEDKKKAEK